MSHDRKNDLRRLVHLGKDLNGIYGIVARRLDEDFNLVEAEEFALEIYQQWSNAPIESQRAFGLHVIELCTRLRDSK